MANDAVNLLAAPTDTSISDLLARELCQIEQRFTIELESGLECVNALVAHIERYRGKMLRPTLVLTTGVACAPTPRQLTDDHRVVATVTEMVHMATLVHDDVLDEAAVRRGGATLNHLRGNESAVMLGDYLISHAYHLCSSLDTTLASRTIADATNTVCSGELLQLHHRDNWELDEATYFEMVRRKTASLCGTCCQLGAMLHNVPDHVAQGLYDYGEKLGIAFQIVDDLLDLTGREQTVGKTLGLDLKNGKVTLPVIRCLRDCDEHERHLLIEQCRGTSRETALRADTDRIRRLLEDRGCVRYAVDHAAAFVADAKSAIDALPDSPAKDHLFDMADAVLTRTY